MGSSKKSKEKDRSREERKEKKRKRRSRSGSREKDREGRHHHRHHHKHKKQRTKRREEPSPTLSPSLSDDSLSDVEQLLQLKDEGPAFHGRSAPPPPSLKAASPSTQPPPPPVLSSGGDSSLSIEETNKIRAKLGLKPLKLDSGPVKEEDPSRDHKEGVLIESQGETFVHKPAESLAQKLEVQKLREKIAAQREKRRIKESLSKVKKLAESDSDDESASAWVQKSRALAKEKALAEKKSKMLEELDAQFGIGDLVEQDLSEQKMKKYSRKNLYGLQVQHEMTRFEDGSSTILTLKDSCILDAEEDALVNVNIVDDERAEKNLKRKREKPDEVEYEAPEVDAAGNIIQRTLLTKYDEEIEGEKRKSFRLGAGGMTSTQEDVPEAVRRIAKLRRLQNLEMPQAQLAAEYLTENEMVSFRKVKKTKKKKKKKLTVDDLEPMEEDSSLVHLGSRHARQARIDAMQVDGDEAEAEEGSGKASGFTGSGFRSLSLKELLEEQEQVKEERIGDTEEVPDVEQDDIELQEALARSRRAKLAQKNQPSSERILEVVKERNAARKVEEDMEEEEEEDLLMTLNTTDEFCRTLGDLPTYGLSGNRAEDDQSMLQLQAPKEKEVQEPRGAWEEVGIDDTRVEITDSMTVPILEEEPDASKGVANALKLALKKGYLEKTNASKPANAALQHLRAIHYSIEDKTMDDERGRGRGERYMGPVTEFKDKDGYRPDVKLEYVDDEGRKLNAKEAFRYLSHKFHGKGSGKNKTEKRMKKWNEELLMKHMSSSDTPLQTLERQREKQRQLGAAYLVLSGSKTQETMDVKK
ncbi:U4/U6.U5 tri-snRNP-associated protein 1-like [Eriocheir sinensis]|uniref:U4/U6.U5 tri-snRNP-associated protein 1-like n=1 Tax=Eriocheir sinensis TaxID=95602 RepID=UPI0021C5AB8D|nr:U4/U6.U5 tri-snRNP-associated protein 1-like [Eriocheir sinensis]